MAKSGALSYTESTQNGQQRPAERP